MTLEEYGALFSEALSRTRTAVPAGTPLGRAADEVLEMAAAYLSDGWTFLRTGDPVNALAAFAYGLGWLDCGTSLGLLEPQSGHPPVGVDAQIPDAMSAHLHEKTHRYRRMLNAALSAVEVGADEASPLYAGGRCFTPGQRSGIKKAWSVSRPWIFPEPLPDIVMGMPGWTPASARGFSE